MQDFICSLDNDKCYGRNIAIWSPPKTKIFVDLIIVFKYKNDNSNLFNFATFFYIIRHVFKFLVFLMYLLFITMFFSFKMSSLKTFWLKLLILLMSISFFESSFCFKLISVWLLSSIVLIKFICINKIINNS